MIVHIHIFKNAGTTIEWILGNNFGERARTFDGKDPQGTISSRDLMDFLSKYPDTLAVSSHHLRFPLTDHHNYNFLPIFFVRHPIDRAFSIHSYFKRRTDDYIFTEKAKTLPLKGFIEWQLESNYKTIKNFQVIAISKNDNFANVETSDIDVATERFRNSELTGIVERMDESLVVAEHYLKPIFNNIDLSYIKQNISPDRIGSLNEKIESGKTSIGDSLMNRLIEVNKLDFELYSITNKILDDRIVQIDNFDSKLLDFKDRRSKLLK